MPKLMFIALSHLSKGDLTIAVEFARQLPAHRYTVCFVTSEENQAYVEQFGLYGVALNTGSRQSNAERFHEVMAAFRPDYCIAADVYTLEYSRIWSGVSYQTIREHYDVPLVTFDQYEWTSTNYLVDFYGDNLRQFPPLIDACDLTIRNCPLNKPLPLTTKTANVRLFGVDHSGRWRGSGTQRRVVLLVNSRWEHLNVTNDPSLEPIMAWMPRLIHNHLVALGQPLTLIHVSPSPWEFTVADHLEYRYYQGMPPAQYEQVLLTSDLFITTNVVSVTLSKAICCGVPAVVFQNDKVLDLGVLQGTERGCPTWLQPLAKAVDVVHPFRIFPWGWYNFLAPVLSDNPYCETFATLPLFERRRVLQTLSSLLYDPIAITDLQHRQAHYTRKMLQLPSAEEAFDLIEGARGPIPGLSASMKG